MSPLNNSNVPGFNPVPTQPVSGGIPQMPVQPVQPIGLHPQAVQDPRVTTNVPAKKPSVNSSKVKEVFARYYTLIIMTLALGLAFGASVLAYQEYGRIAELETERTGKQTELERYSKYASYLTDLSNLKDQLDKNISLSEQSITLKFEIPQLLNQLIIMSKQAAVDVETLIYANSTTDSTGTKKPGAINVQLGVKGDYAQVSSLLTEFENARRLIDIKSMKYTSILDDPGNGIATPQDEDKFIKNIDLNAGKYQVDFTISSYYLGEIKSPSTDLSSLDPEIIGKRDNYDNVVRKLESMQWYDPSDINIQIGSSNPFQLNQSTIQGILPLSSQPVNVLTPQ